MSKVEDISGDKLVIGAAIGYGIDEVFPFLSSLKRTGYQGDIALIVDDRLLKVSHPILTNVILIPAPRWALGIGAKLSRNRFGQWLLLAPWQWVNWLELRRLRRRPSQIPAHREQQARFFARGFLHPQLARFFYYHEFLSDRPYARVMLTDIRDVIFQADPFSRLSMEGLAVSMESLHYTIATQSWNALWMRTAYGSKVMKQIGQNPVSCSGVTFGERDSIRRYLELMTEEILALGFRAVMQVGSDQGVHNFLLWTGKLAPVRHLHSLQSPVATLNEADILDLRFDDSGRLLNQDCSPVAVIHQYDRPRGLAQRLSTVKPD